MKTNFDIKEMARLSGYKTSPNMISVLEGLASIGTTVGLNKPAHLAVYLAQISHESMGFGYDRELWGPTPAQKRYEGRLDLGNTQPGDGAKFAGHTAMQITGRANTGKFLKWCQSLFKVVPDFLRNPALMNTDPWEGLGPIWFWHVGNRTGKSLNEYASRGNFEMVTRIINGGLNGYADRCDRYTGIALRALGYSSKQVKKYQSDRGLLADGISGPATRAKLHEDLLKLEHVTFVKEGHSTPKPIQEMPVSVWTSRWPNIQAVFGMIKATLAVYFSSKGASK